MSQLWQETPLVHSHALSQNLGASVYLKLENLHPSYSFKYRGLSYFVQKAKEKYGPSLHAVIASGGNAGLAAACAARALNVKCTVYIPVGVSAATLNALRAEQATVIITGAFYSEALEAAQKAVEGDVHAIMVPAYDDPIIWEGHGSMIAEISHQLPGKPDAIFCSVGGGGLLGGLIVGCKQVGWDDVPLIALETKGSDCFYHSMSMNHGRFNSSCKHLPQGVDLIYNSQHDVFLAHFNGFSSKASGSLGASEPSAAVVKMALERSGGTVCVSVPDELSMQACVNFADDHKLLVELACSTTLAPAYKSLLFNKLVPGNEDKQRVVVFIICGGFKIAATDLIAFRKYMDESTSKIWSVNCDDGQIVEVGM
ncbi:hypothetical protein AMATHDRAFT_189529 [Amanita thiersii Skay4041]|uniref:L-serine ammonia-lyase n=1 Tax=Amanita thiersii Skay4041 TaxID=703135 RepID=A0A2A9NSR9_9AGAR|nr:hypothetical protein AMATHDRAFT_189529 [Amanita thiersii Skay4041]